MIAFNLLETALIVIGYYAIAFAIWKASVRSSDIEWRRGEKRTKQHRAIYKQNHF